MADKYTLPDAEETSIEQPAEEAKQDKKSKKKKEELDGSKMYVKVYSPYKTYFDGDAQSLSAENDTGPFDVLPRHHNFMTLVNPCEVIIRVDGSDDTSLRISRGVMHVRSNKVTLFLDV